jgi:hypothetical protein
MITRSLGKDELTGLETIHHYDEVTGETHIEYKQDVESILNRNKYLSSTDYQQKGIKNEWMHAATIPEIVQIQWMHKYGIKDIYSPEYWPQIKRLLNGEYKYLKTGNKIL